MVEKKPEMKEMTEDEKTAEVWETERAERHERASGDLRKEEYGGDVKVNPQTAGGKILKGTRGEDAAGARCGYPSKPCNR